jgi:hypothetical protein
VLAGVGLSGLLRANVPASVRPKQSCTRVPNTLYNTAGVLGAWMPSSVAVQAAWDFAPHQFYYMQEGVVHEGSPVNLATRSWSLF